MTPRLPCCPRASLSPALILDTPPALLPARHLARSALLDGADHVVLDGVLHSMSRIRTFDERSDDEWYGSDSVVDAWLHHLAA